MLKKIGIYIATFFGICLLFLIISKVRCNIQNKYTIEKVHSFSIQPPYSTDNPIVRTEDQAVVLQDADNQSDYFSDCYYALLIDDTDKTVLAAKNPHLRMYPASTTKIMTALVVCDQIEKGNIHLDDVVTVENYYDLTEHDLLPCTYKKGSRITIENLLYGLLVESDNYTALILADYIAGSEAAFVDMMNEKAMDIGATNTHFNNPHGLDDPEHHYTTAYDMYLMVRQAYQYDIIRTIDSVSEYSCTYMNSEGRSENLDYKATNAFLTGQAELPTGFHIEIWKTGTTYKSGSCLAMYVSNGDKLYFVFASTGVNKQTLYDSLIRMLCLIDNEG